MRNLIPEYGLGREVNLVVSDVTASLDPAGRKDEETDEFEVSVPSPPELMMRRAQRHVGFIMGGSVVFLVLILAIFAPVLTPSDPYLSLIHI